MGTIDIVAAPNGSHSGSGQGIWTSQAGDMVAWNMYFLGKSKAGKIRGLAIIKWMTTSKKLAWMNGVIAAAETINDMKTMEGTATGYEWK
jgi:hypothetical protein